MLLIVSAPIRGPVLKGRLTKPWNSLPIHLVLTTCLVSLNMSWYFALSTAVPCSIKCSWVRSSESRNNLDIYFLAETCNNCASYLAFGLDVFCHCSCPHFHLHLNFRMPDLGFPSSAIQEVNFTLISLRMTGARSQWLRRCSSLSSLGTYLPCRNLRRPRIVVYWRIYGSLIDSH